MKTFLKLTTAGVIIFIAIFSAACDKKLAGESQAMELKTAPDFDLEKFGGGRAKLSDYRGKVVILDFWAIRCPPCRMEIPNFVDLQQKYGDKRLAILGISLDQNPNRVLPSFVRQYQINYPILLFDGKVDKVYGGIIGIPTTFVINRKGKIYKRYVGFRSKQVFEEDIKTLLN